jgi:hypothetical protein
MRLERAQRSGHLVTEMTLDLIEGSLDVVPVIEKAITSSERAGGIDSFRIQLRDERLGLRASRLAFAPSWGANEYMAEAQRGRNPVVLSAGEVRRLELVRVELEFRFDDAERDEFDLLDEPTANQVVSPIEAESARLANECLFTNESIDPLANRASFSIPVFI